MSQNNVFTGTGLDDVLAQTKAKADVNLKEAFIKLRENESVTVRILSADHLAVYYSHGSFEKGLYTSVCKKNTGVACPICEAKELAKANKDKEWEKALYAKTRVAFAMVDLTTGKVKVFDATKNQGHTIASAIKKYEQHLGMYAFSFTRTGTGAQTTYTLQPELALAPALQKTFDSFNDYELEDTFFADRIAPKGDKLLLSNLKEKGFPYMAGLGDKFDLTVLDAPASTTTTGTKATPSIDVTEDDLPF